MKLRSIFLSLSMIMAIGVMAMTPFRTHRFEQFRVLPGRENAIVFFGNSITNMFEWSEALGNDPRVLNRGVSGAMTVELLENTDIVTSLHPTKVFIGIGTNDLGNPELCSPDSVAARITAIVKRIRRESPQTEVYVQSILPSDNGIRTLDAIRDTNAKVKPQVEESGAVYIDLYDLLSGIVSKDISYDGLHLSARGYALWLDAISEYTGLKPVFGTDITENNGGIDWNSFGMRNTYFSAYPVASNDILILGDEMIHGGEWRELLDRPNVKNRGTGWGYGGLSMDKWIENTDAIFGANGNKAAPAKIVLYAGTEELYAPESDTGKILEGYRKLIERIREYAPASTTGIEILSLIPRNEPELDSTLTIPFNSALAKMAAAGDNIGYIDIYTPLSVMEEGKSCANPLYVSDNFLTGAGYTLVADILSGI